MLARTPEQARKKTEEVTVAVELVKPLDHKRGGAVHSPSERTYTPTCAGSSRKGTPGTSAWAETQRESETNLDRSRLLLLVLLAHLLSLDDVAIPGPELIWRVVGREVLVTGEADLRLLKTEAPAVCLEGGAQWPSPAGKGPEPRPTLRRLPEQQRGLISTRKDSWRRSEMLHNWRWRFGHRWCG